VARAKKRLKEFTGRRLMGAPLPIARVEIDGDPVDVMDVGTGGYLPSITVSEMAEHGSRPKEYQIAADADQAEEAIRSYYNDMAAHDPNELVELLGRDNVVGYWIRGTSFEDVVGMIINDGYGHNLATYDGVEYTIKVLEIYNESKWEPVELDEGEEGLAFRI
jgi:hypothetical protein